MAHGDPVDDRIKQMLQSAVQSVQWTYAIFWRFCTEKRVLVWRDGYYNGAIKTRRTVQSVEASAEEVALSRSDQLRELYDSLASGEQQVVENQQAMTRRPSVALSPEDLTESEWFYLMCVSFSFPPGVGLVGDAYAKQQHVWLTGANDVDSKVYTRTILAKSAHIQTVICIPLLNGVVELGTTEKVQETNEFIEHVKLFFMNGNEKPILPPPRPTLSSHSSNTTLSPHQMPNTIKLSDNAYTLDDDVDIEEKDDEDDDDDEEEEEEDDAGDNEVENIGDDEDDNGQNEKRTCHISRFQKNNGLLQLDMSRDIKLVSPNDGSNNLDSQFNFLATSIDDSLLASTPGWSDNFELHNPYNIQLHTSEHLAPEDTHYSHTVSTIIHNQLTRRSNSHTPHHHPSLYSPQSSFATWTPHHHHHRTATATATAQRLLKSILFTVPLLHSTANTSAAESVASQPPKTTSSHDDLTSASHVIAERRRREKINERFIVLRTLVPLVTKMDKASILGDTIEYVKQLRRKVRDLEEVVAEKRTVRAAEDGGGGGGGGGTTATVVVEVSIIEDDALVEVKCGYREGLLLDVMKKLRDVGVEVTTVESTVDGGLFTAQMRAKVKVRKGNNGKKISITQVKTAIDQIISPSKINFRSSGLGKNSY